MFLVSMAAIIVVCVGVYYLFSFEKERIISEVEVKNATSREDNLNVKDRCLEKDEVADYNITIKEVPLAMVYISVQNKNTKKIINNFKINNIRKNYYPIEVHPCGIYVMRMFNYDPRKTEQEAGFKTELWKYDYSGFGKTIILLNEKNNEKTYESYFVSDFRVHTQETHIALLRGYLESSDYALIVKDLETLKDVFVLPIADVERENPDIIGDVGLKGWSRDGRYFWAGMAYGANTLGFIRMDIKTRSFTVFAAPKDVLGGDALNIEKGLITVHPGNVWYGIADVTEQEKSERRKQSIGTELYVESLFTKKREFVVKTDEPLYYFKPKWLSDTELQYELPNGEKKVYTVTQ